MVYVFVDPNALRRNKPGIRVIQDGHPEKRATSMPIHCPGCGTKVGAVVQTAPGGRTPGGIALPRAWVQLEQDPDPVPTTLDPGP